MTNSKVLERLRAGGFARVAGQSRVAQPWLTEILGRTGYDCVWFDMEHRDFGYDVLQAVSLACRHTGMDLMVRILKTGYDAPMRALEYGANGIMVPHCRSAEEARQWVDWCRFPPLGKRGLDGAGADADWGAANTREHIRHANEQTFVALQIEDREAVECIEEIAAVPGFDILFIGPGDLTLSYGVPLEFNHPTIEAAFDRVAAAAAKHGKWWGTTSGTPEAAQRVIDRGGRMFTAGGDHGWLVGGAQASFAAFSKVKQK
ncbi:MAG: aldolase/citrate lyase family protein [Bryobacteraceae bacterium]